jgi:hypothetical protein
MNSNTDFSIDDIIHRYLTLTPPRPAASRLPCRRRSFGRRLIVKNITKKEDEPFTFKI